VYSLSGWLPMKGMVRGVGGESRSPFPTSVVPSYEPEEKCEESERTYNEQQPK
jgi:hypothetical protein